MVERSGSGDGVSSPSYWYEESDSAVELLAALRSFRAADQDLRRRMSSGMTMNPTDLEALRHVIAHELVADPATPRVLARHLRISGASTSKLIDRLTESGHLERAPHPRDGRSAIVVATDHAHTQVRRRLSRMHERMLQTAQGVPVEARPAVVSFLLAMARDLDAEATPEELTPRDPGPE